MPRAKSDVDWSCLVSSQCFIVCCVFVQLASVVLFSNIGIVHGSIRNNYNNTIDDVYGAVIIVSHCKSSPNSFDKFRLNARLPPTLKPSSGLGLWVCCHPHPPLTFIIITRPESWYSFYCHTDGGRLTWPRHCSKGVQPVFVQGCIISQWLPW